jgi:hypothetical protein
MRVSWFIGALSLACSDAFPPPAGGVADSGQAVDAAQWDGAPALDAQVFDASPADLADQGLDAALSDAASPDAVAPPIDAEPDMAPPEPSATLAVSDMQPAMGCAPRTLILEWLTAEVDACTVRGAPGAFEHTVPLVQLSLGSVSTEVAADTTYTLQCTGPQGEARAEARVAFQVALPPERRMGTRTAVREEQQRCASALGQSVVGGDGLVHDDGASANRICQCAGYARATAWDGGHCFASPHDNTIATWRDGGWHVQGAIGRNVCLDWVACAEPVATCEALLYPQ